MKYGITVARFANLMTVCLRECLFPGVVILGFDEYLPRHAQDRARRRLDDPAALQARHVRDRERDRRLGNHHAAVRRQMEVRLRQQIIQWF